MSGFDWDQPDGLETGNFLKTPGTYHLIVCAGSPMTETEDGKHIDGFKVQFEVAAGTDKEQVGKMASITFFNGKDSHKDGGRFHRQKQGRFFVAANVITPADVPSILARQLKINLDRAKAAQVVATLVPTTDGKFMEVDGLSVYHVDDPAAKAFPKNADLLKHIPKECRRKPEELQAIVDAFAGKTSTGGGSGSANGSANGNGSHGASQQKQPANDDLDDL